VLDPYRLVISFIACIHIVAHQTMRMGLFSFRRCFKTNVIAIVIVITFNAIVTDYTVILFDRNRAGGK